MPRIDDPDPLIRYKGNWQHFKSSNVHYQGTNTKTDCNNTNSESNASFRFTGTYVGTYSEVLYKEGDDVYNRHKAVFKIDGSDTSYTITQKQPSYAPARTGYNVQSQGLEDKEHELVIQCSNGTNTIWVDYIDYTPSGENAGLSKGAIAGTVVGSIGFVAFLAGFIVWIWKRRVKKRSGVPTMTPILPLEHEVPNVQDVSLGVTSFAPASHVRQPKQAPSQTTTMTMTATATSTMRSRSPSPPPYPGSAEAPRILSADGIHTVDSEGAHTRQKE
ncbi:hypothetical protein VNI00_012255 [Paramarasmius palmivorus]|uniref:Uncharacterized protein n=1 Tax=Paramarasmius palmivorus TaxID=297713 RepID=A0AAW0CA42_9AGAR